MELAAERNDRHFLRPRKQPGIRMRKTPAPSRNTLHIAIGQTDCHLPAEAFHPTPVFKVIRFDTQSRHSLSPRYPATPRKSAGNTPNL